LAAKGKTMANSGGYELEVKAILVWKKLIILTKKKLNKNLLLGIFINATSSKAASY